MEEPTQQAPAQRPAAQPGGRSAQNIIYAILGLLEVLLATRLVFLLLGANPANEFIQFIYRVSGVFVAPFATIFPDPVRYDRAVPSVLDTGTIIAMIFYAILAWGIVKLINAFSSK